MSYRVLLISLSLFIVLAGFSIINARSLYDADPFAPEAGKAALDEPFIDIGVHDIGKIGLTIVNQGQFGNGFVNTPGGAPSCQYPYPSQASYLYAGAFWIGAISGRDTLVSVGADGWSFTREFWPDPGEDPPPYGGAIIERSISNADDLEAVSEQDYIAVYTDTVTNPAYADNDAFTGLPHIPLDIEVTQRSYAWSYAYAEDFVLFDYSIKNIGRNTLEKVYMGVYVDADVKVPNAQTGFDDDICGFKRDIPSSYGCGFIDTINVAWIADNNGRDDGGTAAPTSCNFPAVTGTRVVRTPSDSLKYSFNWWVSNGDPDQDWGPRKAGTIDDPYRDFGGFLGTPEGDKNKYYIMRHEEFDYDQLYSALDHTSEGWMDRDPRGADFADGYDTRYLLSFGPFDIDAGEVLPISLCYVAGEMFHMEPCDQFDALFNPYNPQAYNDHLNFDDIGINAVWASWIYDNPGYDTDGDGYSGKYRVCAFDSVLMDSVIQEDPLITDTFWVYTDADTVFYEGDGVPDFRGASPPPAPEVWFVNANMDTVGSRVEASIDEFNRGVLRIKWNGLKSENEKDVFSGLVDFEGYRVWISYTPSASGYSTIASYDIEDYNKYTWNNGREMWELKDTPFSIDSLIALYDTGNGFEPLSYDIDNHFSWYDSAFYFTRQDWNQSELRDTDGIHKIYPDEPPPTQLDLDTARVYYPEELTDDGLFFKYYEYQYVLRNLLPSQLHYVSVTAFDYGSPASGLASLENPPNKNFVAEYPLNSASIVEEQELDVIVYPNPYRLDGNYRDFGFEGRNYTVYNGHTDSLVIQEGLNPDRTQSIHFINLPHKCTIRIFTLDGDLVREIKHDVPLGVPQSSHERWDMITRNTQSVASGIYYYSVESETDTQIGKIVIIM